MKPGDRLGRYEIRAELGAGGMGSVYLACAAGPGGFHRWVAIKRIHPHLAKDPVFVEMFLDEARLAAAVHHPNVAQVHELGEEDGSYFLVLEYLHGAHLERLAREGPIPVHVAARIVADAAEGLHAAHEAKAPDGTPLGIVHRDVSPSNVFVTFDGAVKVTDFGVARAEGRLARTHSGRLKGKCAYVAPEQVYGDTVDRRSDGFALGVVLWELITGEGLFHAESDAETLARITAHDVPAPSERVDCPAELEEIVLRALAPDPEDRYPTTKEMAQDLERFLAQRAEPTQRVALAEWLEEVYASLREERDHLLRSTPTPPPEHAPPSDSEPHDAVTPPPPRPRWRGVGWALGLLTVLGIVTVAAGPFLRDGEEAPAEPAEDEPVATSVVQIDSEPRGAYVTLDGEAREGRTPLLLTEVPRGTHRLELSLPGYRTRSVALEANAPTVQLSLALVPTPETEDAGGRPDAAEPDPVVEASPDRPRRQAPPRRQRRRAPAPERPRAESPSSTSSPEPATARLSLRTRPWATVRLGDVDLGVSPLHRVEIPAGTHVLEVRERGTGQVVRRTIVAEPGAHVTQGIDFPPSP